jgi:hypothetical protein
MKQGNDCADGKRKLESKRDVDENSENPEPQGDS